MSTHAKRKVANILSGEDRAAKRSKNEGSSRMERSTQDKGDSGKNAAKSLQPPGIPPRSPVNIQNGIYAAERLSCAPEITHSINFILRGEIHTFQISYITQLTKVWPRRKHDMHHVVGQAKHYSNGGLRHHRGSASLPPGPPDRPEV